MASQPLPVGIPFLLDGAAATRCGLRLPRRTRLLAIAETAAAAAALRADPRFTMLRRPSSPASRRPDAAHGIPPDAFEPTPQARALLWGVAQAQRDLLAAGGCFDFNQVRRLSFNVSRQLVDRKIRLGELFTVPGHDGRRRFPALQFHEDGTPIQGLRELLAVLDRQDGWAILAFLVRPHALLGGRPVDLLRSGDLYRVLYAARHARPSLPADGSMPEAGPPGDFRMPRRRANGASTAAGGFSGNDRRQAVTTTAG